jgi:hypothetical protein
MAVRSSRSGWALLALGALMSVSCGGSGDQGPAGPGAAGLAVPHPVRLLFADGVEVGPVADPTAQPCLLRAKLPPELAGSPCSAELVRRHQGRTWQPWLQMKVTLRSDAELRIAGLPVGSYELRVRCDRRTWGGSTRIEEQFVQSLPMVEVAATPAR